MKKISLFELHMIEQVAQLGGFRTAATELDMSPSALSHAVTKLEEKLGVRLFNRTTRSITLSAAAFAKGEGKREELQKLLKEKFGVTGIMYLDESKYGEFAAVLREMGANI